MNRFLSLKHPVAYALKTVHDYSSPNNQGVEAVKIKVDCKNNQQGKGYVQVERILALRNGYRIDFICECKYWEEELDNFSFIELHRYLNGKA